MDPDLGGQKTRGSGGSGSGFGSGSATLVFFYSQPVLEGDKWPGERWAHLQACEAAERNAPDLDLSRQFLRRAQQSLGGESTFFVAIFLHTQQPDCTRIQRLLNFSCGCSVSDPGCLSRIPDPNFSHPRSRIRIFPIRDPGSATKNLSILTQKTVSKLSEISSGLLIPDPDFFYPSRIPDPGHKRAPDPGSGSATLADRNFTYHIDQALRIRITFMWIQIPHFTWRGSGSCSSSKLCESTAAHGLHSDSRPHQYESRFRSERRFCGGSYLVS